LARLKGLEPLTHCLEGSCSIRLSYKRKMERVMGIEPTQPAWKAGILPLNYTRVSATLIILTNHRRFVNAFSKDLSKS
jgi:hypothetical protein